MQLDDITDVKELYALAYQQVVAKEEAEANLKLIKAQIKKVIRDLQKDEAKKQAEEAKKAEDAKNTKSKNAPKNTDKTKNEEKEAAETAEPEQPTE